VRRYGMRDLMKIHENVQAAGYSNPLEFYKANRDSIEEHHKKFQIIRYTWKNPHTGEQKAFSMRLDDLKLACFQMFVSHTITEGDYRVIKSALLELLGWKSFSDEEGVNYFTNQLDEILKLMTMPNNEG